MMQDLEAVHGVIFEAFKVLMILGGTDLDALAQGAVCASRGPFEHLIIFSAERGADFDE
jgi:hypothetical protein